MDDCNHLQLAKMNPGILGYLRISPKKYQNYWVLESDESVIVTEVDRWSPVPIRNHSRLAKVMFLHPEIPHNIILEALCSGVWRGIIVLISKAKSTDDAQYLTRIFYISLMWCFLHTRISQNIASKASESLSPGDWCECNCNCLLKRCWQTAPSI